ncbi:MAG: hypothetical protein HY435_00960 [Candidatus Liptonbacteria bacterium]|nr:hypothetical protein [Candidatus Liptonbacteria bacterium]
MSFLRSAGLMAATTLGAGMFALPFVTREAGWGLSLAYLAALSIAVLFAHDLFAKTLEKLTSRHQLLGLTKRYLGAAAFRAAFFVILGGLVLALVIYLILAGPFIEAIFPGMGRAGTVLFWFASSLPIFLELRRLVGAELLGGALMILIIFIIFLSGRASGGLEGISFVRLDQFFLPFGPIIFSLAGWTAIEPILESQKRAGTAARVGAALGTALVSVLYILFVVGIFNSSADIVPDTLSGLSAWPYWKTSLLAWLGLFALLTSYVPIGLEVRNSLVRDLDWPKASAAALVLFLPPLLYFLGLQNFLAVLGLAGGVFLSLQYVFIVLVSKKALALTPWERLLSAALIGLFFAAAAYEVFYFIR